MESFQTALVGPQRVFVEEPQAYFSDSASFTSDSATVSKVSVSAREVDFELETRKLRAAESPPLAPPQAAVPGPGPTGAEAEVIPWDAVVVVGLKIYHNIPKEEADGEVVKLRVVRPIDFSSSEDDDSGLETEITEKKVPMKLVSEASKGLNVDDRAKDATLEGTEVERKMSIDPNAATDLGEIEAGRRSRRSMMMPVWNRRHG